MSMPMPTPVDRTADLETRRPFTRADALAAGVSPSMLKGRRFRRLFTGVYVHAAVPHHPIIRVQGALAIHPPSAFASHTSAARVYDVPVPASPLEHISVFSAKDRRRRGGIRNHVAPHPAEVVSVRGTRVSSAVQMFLELAELLTLVDLVVVGDALVRRRLVTPQQLVTACSVSTRPGASAGRRAAQHVRADVDSPMESRLRMLLVLAGLPEPTVNHTVRDAFGAVLYRFDLSYPDLRIVVEYDGRQHRADLAQWDHDTDRKDWFDAEGWLHVPVFSRGIFRDPEKTVRRVEAALRTRGGLPRRTGDDWRAHFPGY
jgi:very-short-patch-repair endonuclease